MIVVADGPGVGVGVGVGVGLGVGVGVGAGVGVTAIPADEAAPVATLAEGATAVCRELLGVTEPPPQAISGRVSPNRASILNRSVL